MSRYIPGNQKHLTLEDRKYIEKSLNEGLAFKEIARYLCKDPTTISKEIKLHRMDHRYRKGTPMRSGLKGGVENAHTLLRMVLPKGTSFEFLTQWDVNLIVNHINATPRESLGGRTPYDMALECYGEALLKKLQLRPIDPDKVNLTPKLIRYTR